MPRSPGRLLGARWHSRARLLKVLCCIFKDLLLILRATACCLLCIRPLLLALCLLLLLGCCRRQLRHPLPLLCAAHCGSGLLSSVPCRCCMWLLSRLCCCRLRWLYAGHSLRLLVIRLYAGCRRNSCGHFLL